MKSTLKGAVFLTLKPSQKKSVNQTLIIFGIFLSPAEKVKKDDAFKSTKKPMVLGTQKGSILSIAASIVIKFSTLTK